MTFTFGTLCSGIDAAALAFDDLDAQQRFAAEIDDFCCVVLAERYGIGVPKRLPVGYARRRIANLNQYFGWRQSGIPNYGDIHAIKSNDLPAIDLLVSGTPCQDFSAAGLRKGLTGPNGQLTLTFLEIANELAASGRCRAVLWENVPRVLSAPGNPFGTVLGRLLGTDAPIDNPWFDGRWPRAGVAAGPSGAAAWRILDAQYFGLAQRRERLFLVAGVGPARIDPVPVLFERRGLSQAHPRRDTGAEDHADDLLEGCWPPVAFTLRTRNGVPMPEVETLGVFPTLRASQGGSTRPLVVSPDGVRRMSPAEAERIMGFPPGFTDIPWPPAPARKMRDERSTVAYRASPGEPEKVKRAGDGVRFSALGNSKPVPILRVLGAAFVREFSRSSGDFVNENEPKEGLHA